MKFMLRWTDRATGEQKEIEIEPAGDVMSVALPPQPDEGMFGLVVNVNSDGVIVNSHNRTWLWMETYEEMVLDAESDRALDPEDRAFRKKHRRPG